MNSALKTKRSFRKKLKIDQISALKTKDFRH